MGADLARETAAYVRANVIGFQRERDAYRADRQTAIPDFLKATS